MLLKRYFDVSQSDSAQALESNLIQFANEMDFPLVTAALVIDRPGQTVAPAFLAIGNTPKDYTAYKDPADLRRDPVLKRLRRLSVPFIYDQSLYASEGAGDLWERQAPYGYRTGVSVALHLPGRKHFLLGIDREDPLPNDQERLTRLMADLQLLAVHAQAAATNVLVPEDDRVSDPNLSERELEVLRWTMEGKSAWAVGEILGVSENTVNFHFRNIFRKLDASSKHQAVLKAMHLGLI